MTGGENMPDEQEMEVILEHFQEQQDPDPHCQADSGNRAQG